MIIQYENGKTTTKLSSTCNSTIYNFVLSDFYKKNIKTKYDSVLSFPDYYGVVFFKKESLIVDRTTIYKTIVENDMLRIYNDDTFNSVHENGYTVVRYKKELYLFTDSCTIQYNKYQRVLSSRTCFSKLISITNVIYISPGFKEVATKCILVSTKFQTLGKVVFKYAYLNEVFYVLCNFKLNSCSLMNISSDAISSNFPIIPLNVYESKFYDANFRLSTLQLSNEIYDLDTDIINNINLSDYDFEGLRCDLKDLVDYNTKPEDSYIWNLLTKEDKTKYKQKYKLKLHEEPCKSFNEMKDLQELNKKIIELYNS